MYGNVFDFEYKIKTAKPAKSWLAICNKLMQVNVANLYSALQYYHRFTQIFDVLELIS